MKLCWLKIGITCAVGVAIMICGITVGILWSSIYESIVENQLVLSPTSMNYKLWRETPIPMYLKFHMFNWTNPEDFNATNGAKPNFVEMGPYVFRQVDYKVEQRWNSNGTITFQRKRVWHFDELLSNGKLSDEVTNLNPVVATVAYTMRYQKPFVRDLTDRVMRALGHQLVMTKTIGEVLFDGYNDTMLVIANKLNLSKIPYNKFGWFYARNESATYDGTFTIRTGEADLLDLGMLQSWNYNDTSEFYYGECGTLEGSLGDLWPPLKNNETIPIFVSDICTSLRLSYENETTYEGLIGNKYVSDDTMLDNGTNVPSRSCYCKDIDCVPSGAMNISLCKFGAPAFISSPHFYLADPSYREDITGMNPEKEKHEMSITLEPNMGVPLQVKAQLQLNILVQPDDVMTMFQNVSRTFVPMLWFTQEANLTAHYGSQIKFVVILETLGAVTFYGIGAIGILIFFIGTFLYVRQKWRGEEGQVLLSRRDNYGDNGIDG